MGILQRRSLHDVTYNRLRQTDRQTDGQTNAVSSYSEWRLTYGQRQVVAMTTGCRFCRVCWVVSQWRNFHSQLKVWQLNDRALQVRVNVHSVVTHVTTSPQVHALHRYTRSYTYRDNSQVHSHGQFTGTLTGTFMGTLTGILTGTLAGTLTTTLTTKLTGTHRHTHRTLTGTLTDTTQQLYTAKCVVVWLDSGPESSI